MTAFFAFLVVCAEFLVWFFLLCRALLVLFVIILLTVLMLLPGPFLGLDGGLGNGEDETSECVMLENVGRLGQNMTI